MNTTTEDSCRQETTGLYTLSCTKTRWISLTHNRVLHQALARSLRKDRVEFVVEDSWPLRERASGQSDSLNPPRMHITTEVGTLFKSQSRRENSALLLDVTNVSTCASWNLENVARHAEKHVADAVERDEIKNRGSFPATYSLFPLALLTCHGAGSNVHAFIKKFAVRRVGHKS